EQGEAALEPLVYQALEALGATVKAPETRGIEDGRLVDPNGRAAIFEIKGRKGTLRLDDVRQLGGWVQTAIIDEDWNGKGVLIANLKLDPPPPERGDLFGSNAEAAARRVGLAILTTTQLYEALRLDQLGQLDRREFWDEVFNAVGPCNLP